MEAKEQIFLALYTHCIFESAYSTISIHRTEQGARNALAKYIKERRKDSARMNKVDDIYFLSDYEGWRIAENVIMD